MSDVFSRSNCIFNYCPSPDLCDVTCRHPTDNPAKAPEPTPEMVEKHVFQKWDGVMRRLADSDRPAVPAQVADETYCVCGHDGHDHDGDRCLNPKCLCREWRIRAAQPVSAPSPEGKAMNIEVNVTECVVCGAKTGEPCHFKSGKPMKRKHAAEMPELLVMSREEMGKLISDLHFRLGHPDERTRELEYALRVAREERDTAIKAEAAMKEWADELGAERDGEREARKQAEDRETKWANDFRRMENRLGRFLDRAEKAEAAL